MDRAELFRAEARQIKHAHASTDRWLGLILTLIGLICGAIMAAFSVFETKDVSLERSNRIETRLDRIESKLDRIIETR